MKVSLNKAHIYLWVSILPILFIPLFNLKATIDIQLHDTYFVVAKFHIGLLFSIYLALIGFIYWLFRNKKLIPWMTWTHVLVTLTVFVGIIFKIVFLRTPIFTDFTSFNTYKKIVFYISAIFILSQLMFLMNLLLSFIFKPR